MKREKYRLTLTKKDRDYLKKKLMKMEGRKNPTWREYVKPKEEKK